MSTNSVHFSNWKSANFLLEYVPIGMDLAISWSAGGSLSVWWSPSLLFSSLLVSLAPSPPSVPSALSICSSLTSALALCPPSSSCSLSPSFSSFFSTALTFLPWESAVSSGFPSAESALPSLSLSGLLVASPPSLPSFMEVSSLSMTVLSSIKASWRDFFACSFCCCCCVLSSRCLARFSCGVSEVGDLLTSSGDCAASPCVALASFGGEFFSVAAFFLLLLGDLACCDFAILFLVVMIVLAGVV